MAVYQQKTSKQYIAVPREILMDSNLSMKERGLLCTLYSFRQDWHYNSVGLSKIISDGESAIKSVLRSLSRKGYLITKRKRSAAGRFGKMDLYLVLPKAMANSPPDDFPPLVNPTVEKPSEDLPTDEKRPEDNRRQSINNISNNKRSINKESIIKGYNKPDPSSTIRKRKAFNYSDKPDKQRPGIAAYEKVILEQQHKKWLADNLREELT